MLRLLLTCCLAANILACPLACLAHAAGATGEAPPVRVCSCCGGGHETPAAPAPETPSSAASRNCLCQGAVTEAVAAAPPLESAWRPAPAAWPAWQQHAASATGPGADSCDAPRAAAAGRSLRAQIQSLLL